jgi:pimeloyl-ACP methyl ester carboxylesterase
MAFGQDGAGSTILLVHGAISDHGIWDAHAEMISARFRIIRPTLPYFGASPWPDKGEGYSTDAHAAALAQFIDALDLGPMDLVGWSAGGAVCLSMAARRPDLVRRMLLFEPTLFSAVADLGSEERATADRAVMVEKAKALFGAGKAGAAAEAFIDGVNDREGTFRGFPKDARAVFLRNARTLGPLLAGPPPPSVGVAELRGIVAPTTLMLGEDSRAQWQIIVPAIADLIPAATLLTVANARHMWPLEAPQAFAAAVADTFAGQPT